MRLDVAVPLLQLGACHHALRHQPEQVVTCDVGAPDETVRCAHALVF